MTRRPDPAPPPVAPFRVVRDLRHLYVRRWVVVDPAERIIPACEGDSERDSFLTERDARRYLDYLTQCADEQGSA